jgi:CO/xanthine dehydrogenase FAD-binding subunit
VKGFDVLVARDAEHAVALLVAHAPSAKVLAGGTDLLVDLKAPSASVDVLVDISRAGELKTIAMTEDGLAIGALVTHSEIMRSPLIRRLAPALAEAAHAIGAVQTRNLGTLGGNLVSAVPSMDSGPVLLALDAAVEIAGPGGTRVLPLAALFVGPRRTCLAPAELLTRIIVPSRNLGKPAAFLKFGLRKGQALALVNVAVALWCDDGICRAPAIALGAVAPTVMRATAAEARLDGRPLSDAAIAEAARIAAGEARPISDFRASAGYRRELVAVLTRRALRRAQEQTAAPRPEAVP